MIKKLILLTVLIGIGYSGSSQVLISIIFGDKLNSEGLEFGLDGGVNFSTISGMEEKQFATNLHLGFYFDILLKNQWYLNTGVLVKSSQGASSLGENDVKELYPEISNVLDSGSYSQGLGYFNVPIMLKYKFKNHIFAEFGGQTALLISARMNYAHTYDEVELNTSVKNLDAFRRIDAGLIAGLGYKLRKGQGMNIGVKYYQGLVDISKSSSLKNYNNVFYIKVDIPIGRAKAEEKRKAKAGAENKLE
jgi:hypothetical protein